MSFSKQTLRQKLLALLKAQSADVRREKSCKIHNKLFGLPQFQRAKTVMFYCSFDGEVETGDLMQQAKKMGKQIVVPVTMKGKKTLVPSLVENLDHDLIAGPYGIAQPQTEHQKPVDPHMLDLVVVPGVGFDRANHRLGRGQGYYDRFLQSLPSSTPTIGLAFDFQVVESLPEVEAHDMPVSLVLAA